MKKYLLLTLALLTAACATSATKGNYQEYLLTMQGKKESELVRQWGVPQEFYIIYNKRFLEYQTSQKTWGVTHSECYTTFIVENDRVVSFNFRGPGCVK